MVVIAGVQQKSGHKLVFLDDYDEKPVNVKIAKKGDPITKEWTVRMNNYKEELRWIIVRINEKGKIQRKVVKDKRFSDRLTREQVLRIHQKRSDHARVIDKGIQAKRDYEKDDKKKRYSKSTAKNLNRVDFGGKFRDKPHYIIDVKVEGIRSKKENHKHLRKGMVVSQTSYMTVELAKQEEYSMKLPAGYKLIGEVVSKRESWYGFDTAFEFNMKRITPIPTSPKKIKLPENYKIWQLSNGFIYIKPSK